MKSNTYKENIDDKIKQIKKSICKIKSPNGNIGAGFFCNISFPNQTKSLKVLITTNQILSQNDINNSIKYKFNNSKNSNEIKLNKSRKVYNDNNFDITILEIKDSEKINIPSFLDIDNKIFNHNLNLNSYKNLSVFLFDYTNGKILDHSVGLIQDIQSNNTIKYLCFNKKESFGGPIINSNDFKVIGIHKGGENNVNWKWGTFIRGPIESFNQKYKMNSNPNINLNQNNNNYKNNMYQNQNNINYNNSNNNIYQNQNNINYNNSNNNIYQNQNNINYNNSNYNNNMYQNQNNINYNNSYYNNYVYQNQNNMNYNYNNMNQYQNSYNYPQNNLIQNNVQNQNINQYQNNNNYIYNQNMNQNQNNFNLNQNMNNFYQNNINYNSNQNQNINYTQNISNMNQNTNNLNNQMNQKMDIKNQIPEKNQIQELENMQTPNNFQNNSLDYKDIYPYINTNKINITFKISENTKINVKIPDSLKKNELYFTADKVKNGVFFKYSEPEEMQLFYKNQLIEKDDSDIKFLLNGNNNEIVISEKNISLYSKNINIQSTQNSNKQRFNIIFIFKNNAVEKYNMNFENDLPLKELFKIFFSKYSIPEQNQNKYIFKYNTDFLKINDNTPLNDEKLNLKNYSTIYISEISDDTKNTKNTYSKEKNPGIKLKATILMKDRIMNMYAGTLQRISEFYKDIKIHLMKIYDIEEKLIINKDNSKLELKSNDNKTFSDYGIRSDFSCQIISKANKVFYKEEKKKNNH